MSACSMFLELLSSWAFRDLGYANRYRRMVSTAVLVMIGLSHVVVANWLHRLVMEINLVLVWTYELFMRVLVRAT